MKVNQLGMDKNKQSFTDPFTRVGCDTRSIFKGNVTGLKSDFSFS